MKRITTIILVFLTVFIVGCAITKKNYVTIIGQARNAKAGAYVVSNEDKNGYYIDGLHRWDEKFKHKQVEVSGYLKIRKPVKDDPSYPVPSQKVMGNKKIILKPKWKLSSGNITDY